MMRILSIAALIGLALAATCAADKVTLHSGRVIEGKVTSPDSAAAVTIETPFGTLVFRRVEVRSVEKSKAAPATQPDKTPTQSVAVDPAARKALAETSAKSKALAEPQEGVDLWEAFIRDNSSAGPLLEIANKELAVWRDRVAQDVLRFGPQWLPRKDVSDRIAKADSLLAEADVQADLKKADLLYRQAAEQHPFKLDIPYHKAKRYYEAKDMRQYGIALGEVLAIDADNGPARNNVGVLAAQNKAWGSAATNLARAAVIAPSDEILNNLEQVIYLKEASGTTVRVLAQEGYDPPIRDDFVWEDWRLDLLSRLNIAIPPRRSFTHEEWVRYVHEALTATRPLGDHRVLEAIKKFQEQGQHADEQRWSGKWVSKADYDKWMQRNNDLHARISALEYEIRAIEARKSIKGDPSREQRIKLYPLIWGLIVPGHPGQLVLLNEEGGALDTLPSAGGSANSGGGGVFAN